MQEEQRKRKVPQYKLKDYELYSRKLRYRQKKGLDVSQCPNLQDQKLTFIHKLQEKICNKRKEKKQKRKIGEDEDEDDDDNDNDNDNDNDDEEDEEENIYSTPIVAPSPIEGFEMEHEHYTDDNHIKNILFHRENDFDDYDDIVNMDVEGRFERRLEDTEIAR